MQTDLEGSLYRKINDILSDPSNKEQIMKVFLTRRFRRNTGYALDLFLTMLY